MKQSVLAPAKKIWNKLTFLLASLLFSLYSFAQEKKVDININTEPKNDNFFMQPWVWVVGGAVFLLLLVALLRNNNSSKA
jgi:cell division protein FtsW (lipid II flippase)